MVRSVAEALIEMSAVKFLPRASEFTTTGKQSSSWRDDEIQERVTIPVDERLGGCRGFKSHRPHPLSLAHKLRIQPWCWPHLTGTGDSPAHFSTKIISETQ